MGNKVISRSILGLMTGAPVLTGICSVPTSADAKDVKAVEVLQDWHGRTELRFNKEGVSKTLRMDGRIVTFKGDGKLEPYMAAKLREHDPDVNLVTDIRDPRLKFVLQDQELFVNADESDKIPTLIKKQIGNEWETRYGWVGIMGESFMGWTSNNKRVDTPKSGYKLTMLTIGNKHNQHIPVKLAADTNGKDHQTITALYNTATGEIIDGSVKEYIVHRRK